MRIGTTQPKRNFLLLSGVLLLLGSLSLPNIATAQGVGDYLLSILFSFVVSVFGTLAGWAGILLDWAINELVIGFGNLYVTSGLGFTVDAMWVIVRDIFNLTFIFGLVFIGLKMIFGTDNSGQKMLVSLIMAALLVNFSLFITKFVVDFSNIAAVQLVNTFPKKDGVPSISGSFVNAIGLTSLYNVETNGSVAPHANFFSNGSTGGGFIYIFSTMIILLVAAFVFAAGAFLLFIRFALLIFYLILSPLMFLGWIFPGGGSITSQFWSGFLGRAFFAPVYLLLLYLSYQIIIGFKSYPIFQGANFGNLAGAKSSADVFAVLPPFILTAIFLIASVVIAQKMGISGAGGVISMGKSMAGKAKQYTKNAAWGTTKFVASETGGRVARRATYALGNRLSRQVDRFQNSNNRIVRGIARTTGVDSVVRDSAVKLQNARFGLSQTREQEQAASNRIYQAADNRQREQQAAQQVRANVITGASTAVDISNRQAARQSHATEVSQMSNEQIVERARQDRTYVMSPEFASLLSDANVTALKNSGIYNNAEMSQLEENRTSGALGEVTQVLINSNASVDNLNTAIDNLNRTVSTMSDNRITETVQRNLARGAAIDPAFAASITQTQFDNFMGSSASTADKNALRTARAAGQQRIAQHGSLVDPVSPGAISPGATDPGLHDRNRRKMFKNAQQAGALPTVVLRDPAIVEYLTPRIIEEFLNNNPTAGDIADVRLNVMDYITDPATPANVTDTWQNWMNTTVLGRRFR